MAQDHAPAFRHSLRFKLVLASLTLLLIPWVGYRYLQETEDQLRQAQEALLVSRAEVVAGLLSSHSSLLDEQAGNGPSLYVHPLPQAAVIDGYSEEWQSLLNQAKRYRASETSPQAFGFDLLAGYHAEHLFLMIHVADSTPTYARAGASVTSGDHLILALPGEGAHSQTYLIGTSAPGWVRVERSRDGSLNKTIAGEWQETPEGYRVELRIPLTRTQRQLSLALVDIASPGGITQGIASTSGWQRNSQLARLVLPSLPSDSLLQGLDSQTHRYTILNRERQVVGRHGKLATLDRETGRLFRRLLASLVSESGQESTPNREHAGRMDGPEIRKALNGEASVHRYRFPGRSSNTLSAAYPLSTTDEVTGVILVEQSTRDILLLQQEALEKLLGTSLLLFLITGATLSLLAVWLTRRISRLNRKFSQAVSHDGRVIRTVEGNREKDELGNLDRSFSSVLKRLQAYNHYLEQMASRLAHEFRTPLAMVQSSLENMQNAEASEQQRRYTERALEGTRRLQSILTRLREASRLEQALQATDLELIDLNGLSRELCEGYRLSYPATVFTCRTTESPVTVQAAPELVSQALDKLVANAVDFHTPDTPIQISLRQTDTQSVLLSVQNQGIGLPKDMEQSVFDSMVSVREAGANALHLGLGLYLVKLIVEFHHGEVSAKNLEDGVRFDILLPISHSTDNP
jgi:dedicated sortase system histidine kinase